MEPSQEIHYPPEFILLFRCFKRDISYKRNQLVNVLIQVPPVHTKWMYFVSKQYCVCVSEFMNGSIITILVSLQFEKELQEGVVASCCLILSCPSLPKEMQWLVQCQRKIVYILICSEKNTLNISNALNADSLRTLFTVWTAFSLQLYIYHSYYLHFTTMINTGL